MGLPEPPVQVLVEPAWVVADDGVPLAVTVYRPAGAAAGPALVEALPYRQDDVTASSAEGYRRLAGEFGYAVCRVDVRGTGSSGGVATDEYPDAERADLKTVIRWLAVQAWCTGRVGMFGTSYSGFNSLQLAADAPPELGAVFAIYATDDRYTDDVHYCGGVLRALDLVDYCAYMIPMNALPPVPSRWPTRPGADGGADWQAEWRRRLDETPAWLLEWLAHQVDAPTWRRGSLRSGPDGAGYARITVPTMIVAGWADGYRNNTFRTVRRLAVPWRLLAGPWSHQDPARARPGPHLDLDVEMVRWFDEHLRDIVPPDPVAPMQVFVRRSTLPEPDLAVHGGEWMAAADPTDVAITTLTPAARCGGGGDEVDEVDVVPDVGLAAWISCAGSLPWGQPLDQRVDDARSLTYEWPATEPIRIIGNAVVRTRVRASAPVATLVAKLCDVFPDGTSALVTRGTLNLTHRGVWPADPHGAAAAAPRPLVPGEWYDVTLELEAIAHEIVAGNSLRLVLAGGDWPNIWPAPTLGRLGFDRSTLRLEIPEQRGADRRGLPAFVAGDGPGAVAEGTSWRTEHDVLGRTVRAFTRYGGEYAGADGVPVRDSYAGEVGVRTDDPAEAWAVGTAGFEVAWPEATCATAATVSVRSDAGHYHVDIGLTATLDGEPFGERSWTRSFPRHLQ